jgi:hypothetical protein
VARSIDVGVSKPDRVTGQPPAARIGHFHAHDHFFVDVLFEAPLPEGALPAAEFAGPLGPGGPALTFWTSSFSAEPSDPRRVRMNGVIPREAPAGTYRVTVVRVGWSDDMPPAWEPVDLRLDQLGGDAVMVVDPPNPRPQPVLPEIVGVGEVVAETPPFG